MPSLIPFLIAHDDLPAALRASLAAYARSPDPQARARARQVAAAGLRSRFDLSEAEISDLIDHDGGQALASPRRPSASSARAQNT